MPGSDGSNQDEADMIAGLPDDVKELVASVRARARNAPRECDIRALAAEKAARTEDPATVAQINALADFAALRLEEIADVVAELAELTGSGRGRA